MTTSYTPAIVARVAQAHMATLTLGERAAGGLRVELRWPVAAP